MVRRFLNRFASLIFLLAVIYGSSAARGSSKRNHGPVPNGGTCFVGSNMVPLAPFCQGDQYACVVDFIPKSPKKKLIGHCNITYIQGNYCEYESTPFKIGTSGIRAKSTCVSCTCRLNLELPAGDQGECICDPLPPCFQDYGGKTIGKPCPEPESTCFLNKLAVKLDKQRLPIDEGTCHFPSSTEKPFCVSAGIGWGPKFYFSGVKGVPFPGNRCSVCDCESGNFVNCKELPGCTKP